jgi:histidinol-phosphatase (PHP family)
MHDTVTEMIDFHTHTYLCGHATGTPEEYAESAYSKGITILGFSDHSPLPDGMRENVTMRRDQTEEYLARIQKVKKEYIGKVDIRIGFEVDFPLRDSFDSVFLSDPRLDYLIGSCHYLGDWPIDYDGASPEYKKRGINNIYEAYYDSLLECAGSGLFNFLGHFDLPKKFGHHASTDMRNKITSVARAAAGSNTAVEINTSGLRKPVGEMYPSEKIVQILFEQNVPITLGSDAHAPNEVGADIDKASALLKKVGYTRIVAFKNRKQFPVEL